MGKRSLTLVGAVLMALGSSGAARAAEPFPFVIPWDDGSPTVVDVSALNPAPLDDSRRITIRDGRFYDQTGRRVRFLGVNFCAGGCFPTKENAQIVARRLRKYGVNAVRLHHMDASWASPNIFYIEGHSYGKPTDRLDPESLDRLDYFIYQLKRNGIYVDINLHVSREFIEADGFPDADQLPYGSKVVGYFVPDMIARQKQYAEQLLTHRNPYTGNRYVDEPAVALIEITNEHSLLASAHEIPRLPEYYQTLLGAGWNEFLRERYGSTERLLEAWNAEAIPLGDNILRNPRLLDGTTAWSLETHAATSARMTAEEVSGAGDLPPGRALRLSELQIGDTDWHLQLHQTGLDFEPGRLYTVSFAARSPAQRWIHLNARLDHAPWTVIGLDTQVRLVPEWRRYQFSFTARGSVPGRNRLSFVLGGDEGEVWLADLSVRPGGGAVELAAGESLEAGTIPLAELAATPQGRDYAEYLIEVERQFTREMHDFIKDTLGAQAPVTCTQASYGGVGGLWREAQLDWVDMHSYWQHPWFPNRPWDSNDYRIGNTAMVRDPHGGTLDGLAMYRAAGKPFTVSEYDHPAPSEYAAESVPMIFSFAAWQDWDGVFLFDYHGDDTGWDRDRIAGFFDHAAHPGKHAFFPAAAQMFLRGCVAPAPEVQTLLVPEGRVAELTAERAGQFWERAAESGETVSRRDLVARRSAVRFVPGDGPVALERTREPAEPETELRWQAQDPTAALYTVDSPCAKAVVGFLGGRSVALEGLTVAMEPTERGFVSLTLTSMDGRPAAESESLLLTVVDKVENPGLEWNEERTFARNSWAQGPTMAYGVPVTITLETRLSAAEVWALDAAGARRERVASELSEGRLRFRAGPEHQTLWFEIAGR